MQMHANLGYLACVYGLSQYKRDIYEIFFLIFLVD